MTESEGRAPQQNPANTRPEVIDTREISRLVRQRELGRYARAWREGFVQGALDALRTAHRQLPPETRPTLRRLADAYKRAGDS
jgi:hypothetical protein